MQDLTKIEWRRVPAWLLRAWPLLALVPVLASHWLALSLVPAHAQLANKVVGMLLQVAGGLLILYSVNDNLGLFRRQTLVSAAFAWLKSFPREGTSTTLAVMNASHAHVSGAANVTAAVRPASLEERMEYLEATVDRVRQDLAAGLTSAQRQLEGAKAELSKRIDGTDGQILELGHRVEQAAVGGFKLQGFGVLLAIYGAVTSVFA